MVISWITTLFNTKKSETYAEQKEVHEVRVRDLSGLNLYQGNIASFNDLQDKIENEFGIAVHMQQFVKAGCTNLATTDKDLGNGPCDLTFILCQDPGNTPLPPWQYVPSKNRLNGYWYTPMSVIYIGPDMLTGRLAYNEMLYGDTSSRLHGWMRPKELTAGSLVWRVDATKIVFDKHVWYGPSFGDMPPTECVIDITFCNPQCADDDMLRVKKSTKDDQEFASRFFPEFESNNL